MTFRNYDGANDLKILFSIAICIGFISCNTADKLRNDDIVIQADIAKNPVYKKLDNEKDYPEVGYYAGPKSSDVRYLNDRYQKLTDTTKARNYNCKSFFHGDTLSIIIGIGSGDEGSGFIIDCKDKLFSIKPYYFTDNIITGQAEPTYETINQSLYLDKTPYKIGDSIYGKVNFKVIEHSGQKVVHIGDGYFRAKIIKEL
jgi:hypothetical protein